jgi:hypothetical protein
MTDTLAQINTALNGTTGQSGSGSGATSGAGGDADETFSNDGFPNNGGSDIAFTPTATAGTGALGNSGTNGAINGPTLISGNEVYGAGGDGQDGGDGGDGGSASITLGNDSAGTSGTASTTGVQINASVDGGKAGGGNFGGGGGSGGASQTGVIAAQGGNGGDGGSGGLGGGATLDVSGFVSYNSSSDSLLFTHATGASGGIGFGASAGAQGATPSNGGTGGAGGAGGSVTDTFTGSTVVDNAEIFVSSTATSGAGAAGGEGGQAGYGESITNGSFETINYGVNGDGGAGGAGGDATDTISNDFLTAPFIEIEGTVDAAAGAAGGISPSETSAVNAFTNQTGSGPGATGATGAQGVGQIDFTGNTITVGQGLNGSIHQPGELALDLEILNLGTANNNVIQNLNGGAGGNLVFSGNDFVGQGNSTLNLGLAGTGSVTIDTGAQTISIGGSPGNAITGFSTLDLDTNNTVIAGAGSLTLEFASDPDTLIITPTSGSVQVNLATTSNMVLEFEGFGSSLTASTLLTDTTTNSGNTFITIGGSQIELTGFTSTIPTADEQILCYREGTCIATPNGAVAVENLVVGGLVLTHDGEALPIVWIGWRHVDCRGHAAPETVLPIRVAAHAFGDNLPRRDLFLSPDHAIYADGVLIPVKYLIDGISVARVAMDHVTYYHVELESHAEIMAEGLPAESFLDVGDRSFFTGGVVPHPSWDRVAMIREADCAAPLYVTGPVLDRVRNDLASRASGGVVQAAA